MSESFGTGAPRDGLDDRGETAELVFGEDEELAERLGAPSSVEALYLEEASYYRPIITGDIFVGVPVPGSTEEEQSHSLTMLLSHPSAMRKGALLEQRARAAPVVPQANISKAKYTPGHYDVFPLPALRDIAGRNGFDIADEPWGVMLDVTGTIQTYDLDVARRVACLAPEGLTLLVQKLVFADTRVAVRESSIAAELAPKLEEVEQLQTWNEDLVLPKVEAGADLQEELSAVAVEFENALAPLRGLLADPGRRGEVWRRLMVELAQRRAG